MAQPHDPYARTIEDASDKTEGGTERPANQNYIRQETYTGRPLPPRGPAANQNQKEESGAQPRRPLTASRYRQIRGAQKNMERLLRQEPREKRNRIPVYFAALMGASALMIDGIQALVGVLNFVPAVGIFIVMFINALIGVIGFLTIYVPFKIRGVNFMRIRNGAPLVGGTLAEVVPIPFISMLPMWTGAVVLITLFTWMEDWEYNQKIKKEDGSTA